MAEIVTRPGRADMQPAQAPELTLHVNDQLYRGWQRVSVTRSMQQLAGTFDLTLTDQWALDDAQLQLLTGQRVQVSIAGTPVLTGWVDEVAPSIGPRQHELRVSGRDAAGDLVDCSVLQNTQEIVGRNLLQVASSICAPFGISVRTQTNIGAVFATTHFEVGETVYELLQTLCRLRGVLCMSDGNGGLVFVRAGSNQATQRIDDNVLRGSARRNAQDRFQTYRVLGQQRGTDNLLAEPAAQAVGEVTDVGIKRYRPIVIQTDEPASSHECTQRAQWERSVRAGRANSARVTLLGWLDGGTPWAPNTLIHANYRALGLAGEYLISEVEYAIDDHSGQVTTLTLQPPDAYKPMPRPDANPAADGGVFQS